MSNPGKYDDEQDTGVLTAVAIRLRGQAATARRRAERLTEEARAAYEEAERLTAEAREAEERSAELRRGR